MAEFMFDVKLFATIRVNADSEREARRMINAVLNGADANFGAWPNGDPILGTVSQDNPDEDTLVEIDGEAV